ncbi:unnamed protein product [Microthlaspi erraticum]|uniref:Uncharacterized protein n=1 Tax=Microthlaspi erraticum TaxID=1685480 RepID=A0A6D2IKK2_9BRAS|nr:unnamed protein product [Microthlaspi erraticum]
MKETPKKIGFLLLLLHSLTFFLIFSPSTQNPQEEEEESHYCSKLKTRDLYLSPISNQSIIAATNLITCRSGKLYFKTSIGLFHVSSIDYATKTLILSHSSGSEKVKKLGARVSLEVDGHLPDLCIACERPDGNCGAALRCLCHPKDCKNKIVNIGTKSRALSGKTQIVLLFSMTLFLICF